MKYNFLIKQFKLLVCVSSLLSSIHILAAPPLIHCEGKRIVDESGNTVILRGVNLGSWLLNEIWMTHTYGVNDDKGVRDALETRFGKADADSLLRVYQNSYIKTTDFDNIKSLGLNCIRLPFFYKILEDDSNPGVYLDRGWELLDFAISNCAVRDMYCIIDMHGAPGGQNSDHTCGQAGVNQLYSDTNCQQRMVDMWVAIADRYKNEPAVAAFDLLNEPWGDYLGALGPATPPDYNTWTGLYGRAYSAIRNVDPKHIIVLTDRGPWCGIDELPVPSQMGWENIMYEFHPYDFDHNDFISHKNLVDSRVRWYGAFQSDRDVPILIGEFHPQGGMQSWAYYLRHFNAYGWNWTIWSYKCHQYNGDWGIKRTWTECNVMSDSYVTLSNKFVEIGWAWSDKLHENVISKYSAAAFDPGGPRLDFYKNSFSTGNGRWLSDYGKLFMNTDGGTADTQNNRARISPPDKDWGLAFLKVMASDYEDAWFTVQDSTGCWFEIDIDSFNVASSDGGNDFEAEVKFGVFREPIVENPYFADTAGIMAIIDYNSDDGWMRLNTYRKNGGSGNNGSSLSGVHFREFVPGATLGIFVNNNTAEMRYNGETLWSGSHGANLHSWLCGGVAAMSISHHDGQRISYAEVDDLRIYRPGANKSTNFSEGFLYQNDMPLNAVVEKWTLRPNTDFEAYVYNGNGKLKAADENWARVWMTAQSDAQNPVRFNVTNSLSVVEINIAGFTVSHPVNGDDLQLILTFFPEYFSGPVWDYNAKAFNVKIGFDSESSGLLDFSAYRHEQVSSNGERLAETNNLQFIPGATCRVGFDSDSFYVSYHGQQVCSGAHGIDNVEVFQEGAFLHLDLQNVDTGRGELNLDWVQMYTKEIPEPVGIWIMTVLTALFIKRNTLLR